MAKCLRCGAGPEWIKGCAPSVARDEEIADLRAEIERLRKRLATLEAGANDWADQAAQRIVRLCDQVLDESPEGWSATPSVERVAEIIREAAQPRIGDIEQAIQKLRDAGLSAWDEIDDPDEYIRDMRS